MARKGVSLKIRNRITKEHRLFPRQRYEAIVRIIGDPKWEADFKAVVDQGAKYVASRAESWKYAGPYSEADRLSLIKEPVNSVLKNINLGAGVWVTREVRPVRSRFRRLRGNRRRLALRILNELHGINPTLSLDVTSICVSPGKLDARLEWLLFEIYSPHNDQRGKNFLITVAKDAGVWPIPVWWRVTRILLGDKRFLEKSK